MKFLLFVTALFTLTFTFSLQAQTSYDKALEQVTLRDYDEAKLHIDQALRESPNNIDVLVLAGDIYSEIEQTEKALTFYKKGYELDKDKSSSARKYAKALTDKDKNLDAIVIMRKAIKNDPKDVFNTLTLCEALINADSMATAELLLVNAREKNKKLPEPVLMLGYMYYKQNVLELAQNNFEAAIALDGDNIPAREKLATTYFRMANRETGDNALANELYNRSLTQWAEITKRQPKNARAYFEQGKIRYYASQFSVAAPLLNQYLRLRPDAENAIQAHWFAAQSWEKARQYDSSIIHLEYIVKNVTVDSLYIKTTFQADSVRDLAQTMVARSYFDTKNYNSCKESFSKLVMRKVDLSPDDKERYGYALILTGDTLNGIPQIRAAVDADPKKCLTALRLGNLYNSRKLWNDAIAMYQRRIECSKDSNEARILAQIGVAQFSAGRLDEAIPTFQKAIALDSTLLFVYFNLSNIYNTKKMFDDEKKVYKSILDIAKSDKVKYKNDGSRAYSALCRNALDAKDYSGLKVLSASYIDFDSSSEIPFLYAAVAAQGSNDKDNACKYYNEALKRNPKNETALKNKKTLGC